MQHCRFVRLARPTLSSGDESWTVRADERRLMSAEMLFMRTDKHTLSD
jgi:hypothetical protein